MGVQLEQLPPGGIIPKECPSRGTALSARRVRADRGPLNLVRRFSQDRAS